MVDLPVYAFIDHGSALLREFFDAEMPGHADRWAASPRVFAAAQRAFQAPDERLGGVELYPDLPSKAASLAVALMRERLLAKAELDAHAALLCAVDLVEWNGQRWTMTAEQFAEILATARLAIDEGALAALEPELVTWFRLLIA